MIEKLLHTPEGVRDIYDRECKTKNSIESRLGHVMELFGYQEIETPTFEFFDVFNHETGTVSSREMYKFFDRNNDTLVLRPDMTPSIARSVAKYYSDCDYHETHRTIVGSLGVYYFFDRFDERGDARIQDQTGDDHSAQVFDTSVTQWMLAIRLL